MEKLNLGCGKNWQSYPGFDGQDIVDFGQRLIFDMEEIPWPIADEHYKEIRAFSVLEHIHQDKVIAVMNECWRILKRGGKFHIKVPKFPHDNAVQDPTHFSFWVPKTFTLYFAGKSPMNADYGIQKWGICNDGKGNYLMEIDDRNIDIWLYKK